MICIFNRILLLTTLTTFFNFSSEKFPFDELRLSPWVTSKNSSHSSLTVEIHEEDSEWKEGGLMTEKILHCAECPFIVEAGLKPYLLLTDPISPINNYLKSIHAHAIPTPRIHNCWRPEPVKESKFQFGENHRHNAVSKSVIKCWF